MARKPRKPRRRRFKPEPHIDTTIDLLIAGLPLPAILRYLQQTETTAPRDDEEFHELLDRAKATLRERTDRHADIEDEVHLARLASLYQKAVAAGQLAVAVSIEKEQHRLAARRRRAVEEARAELEIAEGRNGNGDDGVIPGTRDLFRNAMSKVKARNG